MLSLLAFWCDLAVSAKLRIQNSGAHFKEFFVKQIELGLNLGGELNELDGHFMKMDFIFHKRHQTHHSALEDDLLKFFSLNRQRELQNDFHNCIGIRGYFGFNKNTALRNILRIAIDEFFTASKLNLNPSINTRMYTSIRS